MAYIVMVYTVMACIVMAYTVTASIVMARLEHEVDGPEQEILEDFLTRRREITRLDILIIN